MMDDVKRANGKYWADTEQQMCEMLTASMSDYFDILTRLHGEAPLAMDTPDAKRDRSAFIRDMSREHMDYVNICEHVLGGCHAKGEYAMTNDKQLGSVAAVALYTDMRDYDYWFCRGFESYFYKTEHKSRKDIPATVREAMTRIESEVFQEGYTRLCRYESDCSAQVKRSAFYLGARKSVYDFVDQFSDKLRTFGKDTTVCRYMFDVASDSSHTPEETLIDYASQHDVTAVEIDAMSDFSDEISYFKDMVRDGLRDGMPEDVMRSYLCGFDVMSDTMMAASGFDFDQFVGTMVASVENDIEQRRQEFKRDMDECGGIPSGGTDLDPRYLWQAPEAEIMRTRETGISPGMRERVREMFKPLRASGFMKDYHFGEAPEARVEKEKKWAASRRADPDYDGPTDASDIVTDASFD